ncbi:aldehyde dehydrogenase family protein, partial [Streptomyces niveiscabiei]
MTITHDDWLARAKAFTPPRTHLVDGVEEPGGGGVFRVVSPRDGQPLAEVADGGPAEVDAAVAAARRAFDHGPWPRLAPGDRGRVLVRLAELLDEHRDDLA